MIDTSPETVQKIKEILTRHLSIDIIYVFGSYAKGKAREDSDIDIAFLSERDFEPYDIFMLSQELADVLEREVDLVQLKQSSTVFQAQVVGDGKAIYFKDEQQKQVFEMLTLKKYAKLNEERQPILDKIKESGNIYGT